MKLVEKAISEVVCGVYNSDVSYRATKYLSKYLTVKATKKRFKTGTYHKLIDPVEIVVTVGGPNYEEREFIKKCKQAGEPFPIKKVQYKLDHRRS